MPRNALVCTHLSRASPTWLSKTHALTTHVLCLFCLHQIFQDHFILLSMKLWQFFDSATKGHQTTSLTPFLGHDFVRNFPLLGSNCQVLSQQSFDTLVRGDKRRREWAVGNAWLAAYHPRPVSKESCQYCQYLHGTRWKCVFFCTASMIFV